MATDSGEPEPGATDPEAKTSSYKEFLRASAEPLDLDKMVEHDPFKEAGFDPEVLKASSEKVSRYIKTRTQGMDGQPLQDEAQGLAVESLRAEADSRVEQVLVEVASGKRGYEIFQELQETALDTLFLGVAVDPYILEGDSEKFRRYVDEGKALQRDADFQDTVRLFESNISADELMRRLEEKMKARIAQEEPQKVDATGPTQDKLREELARMHANNPLTQPGALGEVMGSQPPTPPQGPTGS